MIFQHFIVYLQNNTDSLRFTHGSFARMAELVDALDSKSNVLKKTCRFEPGFGHKKMRVKTLIFLCPDGTFVFIGECVPQCPFCRFAPWPPHLPPPSFFCALTAPIYFPPAPITGERAPCAPSPQGLRFAVLRTAADAAVADFVCSSFVTFFSVAGLGP